MEERKRILLLGGTGTIGEALYPALLRRGFAVFITSRSAHASNERKLVYLTGNAKDEAFLDELLSERFDAIVDFMIYTTESFAARAESCFRIRTTIFSCPRIACTATTADCRSPSRARVS